MADKDWQASDGPLDELAAETERAFDEAVYATAQLARGKTLSQVDEDLRVELRHRGIEPTNSRQLAERILAGLAP